MLHISRRRCWCARFLQRARVLGRTRSTLLATTILMALSIVLRRRYHTVVSHSTWYLFLFQRTIVLHHHASDLRAFSVPVGVSIPMRMFALKRGVRARARAGGGGGGTRRC